jgi:ADP-heptose:LPS heptosyltransferase
MLGTFDKKLLFDHYLGGVLAWTLNALARLVALVWHRDHSLERDPRAVLVLKFLGMGSIVRASFLLKAIKEKYPDSQLYFATFSGTAPLVRMYREVNHVFVVRDSSFWYLLIDTVSLVVFCWRNNVDLVVDLEVHAKYSSIISALSLARDRAGFAGITSRFRRGLYTHLVFWNPVRYVGRAYEQLGAALGLEKNSDAQVCIPPSAVVEAQEFLIKLGWREGVRLIGINPNASDLRIERLWPREYFSALLSMLPPGHDFIVLVCGSKAEWEHAESVRLGVERCPYPVFNIAGALSFSAYCEVLRKLSVLVTNDSGPMHVARAFEVPTVSLWGPTHPANYSPPGRNHLRLYRPIYCSPCTHATDVPPCGGDNQCLKRLEPGRVLRAVCSLLGLEAPSAIPGFSVHLGEAPVLGYWQRSSVDLPAGRAKDEVQDEQSDLEAML